MESVEMRARRAIAVGGVVVASYLAGCGGSKPDVRIVGFGRPKGCSELGQVTAKGTSELAARNGLRERAREIGADTVVIEGPMRREPAGRIGLDGTAMRCRGVAAVEMDGGAFGP